MRYLFKNCGVEISARVEQFAPFVWAVTSVIACKIEKY